MAIVPVPMVSRLTGEVVGDDDAAVSIATVNDELAGFEMRLGALIGCRAACLDVAALEQVADQQHLPVTGGFPQAG